METIKNNFENVLCEYGRVYKKKAKPSYKVSNSDDTQKYIKSFIPSDANYKEFFHVIYLNNQNMILGYEVIGEGGITGVVADVRLIFSGALLSGATSIIVTHNHPSGNLKASQQDINITKRIKEIGALMEIPLLDHIITTEDSYMSFADECMM